MTPNVNGFYCHSCKKTITDITDYSKEEKHLFSKVNPKACVIDLNKNENGSDTNWFSTRKFALALLIIGSTTLFSFAEPTLGKSIDEIRESFIGEVTNDSLKLTIELTDQNQEAITGIISLILPNKKTIIPEFIEDTKNYIAQLPAYCVGKEIEIKQIDS